MRRAAPLLLLALAACGGAEPAPEPAAKVADEERQAASPSRRPPRPAPPQPQQTGLDGEQQDARAVVSAYFAHIEAGDYGAAWALRWKGEGDDGASRQAFIDSQARHAEHHATVGIPGPVEGAAGSLYVEVPVQLYGRLTTGKPFSSAGTVTLRRVNDVPGSSAEQRRWRIYSRD